MTPEEIRAEAIERAATQLAADEQNQCPTSRHYAVAEGVVDALGDLLPTDYEVATEIRDCGTGELISKDRQIRYVTAWQEITR